MIPPGGLPVPDALAYAVQLVNALAAAHAAGIVHRDIKPGNVMVSADGVLKILDFGLAKVTELVDAPALITTRSAVTTNEGVILGTVAYMSPEQAEGQRVDARSDIFSLGCVMYEMLTGRRPFVGDSQVSILAAILHKEPEPLRRFARAAPARVESVVMRCLRKDRADRFANAVELRTALAEVTTRMSEVLPNWVPSLGQWWRGLIVPVTCVTVAVVLAAIAWTMMRSSTRQNRAAPPKRVTNEAGSARYPALSPDGKLVAYASDRSGNFDIYVQQVGGEMPIRVTSSENREVAPSFTPDGKYIVFQSDQKDAGLQVVSALGGQPRVLASEGYRPKVSPDGTQVLFWASSPRDSYYAKDSGVYVVPFRGGVPRRVHPEFFGAGFPVWLDGRRIIFSAMSEPPTGERSQLEEWWISDLSGAPATRTTAVAVISKLGDVKSGMVPDFVYKGDVYSSLSLDDAGVLVRVRLDPKHPESGITAETAFTTLGKLQDVSVGGSGLVAFADVRVNNDLYRLRFNPATRRAEGNLERLTDEPSQESNGSVTRDGQKLMYYSDRGGVRGVWIRDLATGHDRRLADVLKQYGNGGEISPTGEYVAFVSPTKNASVARADGTHVTTLFPDASWPDIWMSDHVLRVRRVDKTFTRLQYVDVDVRTRRLAWQSRWFGSEDSLACSPRHALEWCSTQDDRIVSRPIGTQEAPKHVLTPLGFPSMFNFISESEDTIYWLDTANGSEAFRGRRVDPRTGLPVGGEFIAFRMPRTMHVEHIAYQGQSYRANSVILTLRDVSSNVWLQELPGSKSD